MSLQTSKTYQGLLLGILFCAATTASAGFIEVDTPKAPAGAGASTSSTMNASGVKGVDVGGSTGTAGAKDAAGTATEAKAPEQKTWKILPSDGRLATTFERWTKVEGMKLIWDAKQHISLSSSDSFTGSFQDALTRVLSSPAIRQSTYPLEACIYPNNPPVLRITRLGEQSQECPQ